ncbi:PPOX class F420-dependent oxidoreductase [Actinoplanes siamensis]|uniref:PPOX class F420-dependent enzyme n=1 Tax=Actinoplanes siamensis TaxID=1223317 RepID=A0A919N280_9ACTN|nr:PPOX class F420-dependent oxidoreductase [Actinoplanes siamensis]GIF03386.1 PPOX class F420-dependent enzyme [Actinoplanes siamensis]
MSVIPDSHVDLLQRPLFGHLGTTRPDGQAQVNPMWFSYDGEFLYFTNSTQRRKYHNLRADPRISLSINDPEQPYRYLEVRGVVERIDPDTSGEFFAELAARYDMRFDGPPGDVEHRVVLVVRPTAVSFQ